MAVFLRSGNCRVKRVSRKFTVFKY